MIGIGIIIPILAPLVFDYSSGIIPASMDASSRALILGVIISAYPMAQFFSAPILGALSDNYGRKKLLLLSLAGTFLGYILFAIGIVEKNIYLLLISRTLDGFTGGNISIAMSSIADVSDEKSKAKNFGLIGMTFGFGFIIGPYIGGKLADPTIISWFNYTTPFWFAAILSLINIGLLTFFFKETLKEKIHTKVDVFTGIKNISKAFKNENLRVLFLTIFMMTLGFNFFTQFFQVYLIQKFAYNHSQIADLFAYIGIWIALTQGVISRKLGKYFESEQILKITLLTLSVALILLLVPDESKYIYLILPLVSISNGLTMPNQTAIVSNMTEKTKQGEILGINQSIQSLASAIPPIIAGIIVSIDKILPITVSATCIFIAWLIFVLFFRPKKLLV